MKAGDVYIDARHRGGMARFINHSCEPNTVAEKWIVNGEIRVAIIALYPLPRNAELTLDYNFELFGMKPQRCLCRAASCVGWLGGVPKDQAKVASECPVCRARLKSGAATVRCGGGCSRTAHKKCTPKGTVWSCAPCRQRQSKEDKQRALIEMETTSRQRAHDALAAISLPKDQSVGSVVWAKMRGYPWWPARVAPVKHVTSQQLKAWGEDTPVLVEFYGTNNVYGTTPPPIHLSDPRRAQVVDGVARHCRVAAVLSGKCDQEDFQTLCAFQTVSRSGGGLGRCQSVTS
mmetsp:Transcript_2819/g.7290  ORF Transcript_2819/g.7290 Transcript_2819/m.7290 type:complete len:289 (+) Transcript_2819:143-1009(+)